MSLRTGWLAERMQLQTPPSSKSSTLVSRWALALGRGRRWGIRGMSGSGNGWQTLLY